MLIAGCNEKTGESSVASDVDQSAKSDSNGSTPQPETAKNALEDTLIKAPEGALPMISRPLHYQLDLNINPNEQDFSAKAVINIELLN